MRARPAALALLLALLAPALLAPALPARAQDNGAQEAAKRAAVLRALPEDAAKRAFGTKAAPAALPARAIGGYAKGCLAGATALPVDGATWQVMRMGRGRNYAHPAMIAWIERFAAQAPLVTGWPGLLVGDLAQPRGGPMLTGHASHQIGLDADLWLTPMPERRLTRAEREEVSAVNVVGPDWNDVDPAAWTPAHLALLRLAARQPGVARIFVNPAIKRGLCRQAGADRAWLSKVRPAPGHNYHFHVRLACPKGSEGCEDQDPVGPSDGCDASLDWWFSEEARRPKPPRPPAPPMSVAALPAACRQVLLAP